MTGDLLQTYVNLIIESIRTKKGLKNDGSGFGDKFNLKKFKELPSSEIMKKYAANFLQPLSLDEQGQERGSSRTVFLLGSKYALKIAMNKKGTAQNEAEMDVSTSPNSKAIFARVHDADDKFLWLISDLVDPIKTPEQFESLTGLKWEQFSNIIAACLRKGHPAPVPTAASEFAKTVVTTAKANRLMPGDLCEISHWGKTADGRCVLLDYGFTQDVSANHYPRPDDVNDPKTAAVGPKSSGKKTTQKKPDAKTLPSASKNKSDEEKTKKR